MNVRELRNKAIQMRSKNYVVITFGSYIRITLITHVRNTSGSQVRFTSGNYVIKTCKLEQKNTKSLRNGLRNYNIIIT